MSSLPSSPFMREAFRQAHLAQKRGEVPVGAAIVSPEGSIISAEGNRMIEKNDPTAHAELLAIRAACAHMKCERLTGFDLYVTLEPCTMCAGAISFARLRRLYFAAYDIKGGAVENGVGFFAQPSCHHSPDIYGGINEKMGATLLRSFFQARRKGKSEE